MSERFSPGFYPFWFWNDALEEAEVRRQIAEMAAQGVKGFYIHPRQGLQAPYLSESFFRMVEVAVEEAERHGLTVHLYDEYPYPSGVAGGEAILGRPAFFATRLVQRSYDLAGGRIRLALPRGKLLACIAYPLRGDEVDFNRGIDLKRCAGIVLTDESYVETGLTQYNRKRYFASEPTPVLEAELPMEPHRLFVSVQALVEGHKYWDHFIDVLNPEAVREFIRLTHERYAARFQGAFGRRIPPFSSTRPFRGGPRGSQAPSKRSTGTTCCRSCRRCRTGRTRSTPRWPTISHRLKYKLFVESFEEPIARWCKEHGLLYAGEKPSLRFSQLRYSDVPGADPGHTKAGAKMDLLRPPLRANARAVASAAYFYGKPGSLVECYHSLGWSGTLQDAKLIAEGPRADGRRLPGSPRVLLLDPRPEEARRPALLLLSNAVLAPVRPPLPADRPALPAARREPHRRRAARGRPDGRASHAAPIRGVNGRILDALMEARVDFHIVDTDILESGRIEQDASGTTRVHVREIAARAVLLPPMQVVEAPLKAWLDRFEERGGAVLRFDAGCEKEAAREAILAAVRPHLDLRILEGDGKGLQLVTRVREGRRSWFLLNTARERLEVEIRTERALVEVPLDEVSPAVLSPIEGGYRRTVAPFESLLLEEAEEAAGEAAPEAPQAITVEVTGPMQVIPANANLLRLYHWEMALLDEEGRVVESAPAKAVPLANQLSETGLRFAPRCVHSFGAVPALGLPELRVRYRATFEAAYDGPVELVMEPGSIVGAWTVRVNDGPALDEKAFAPTRAHVRGSLGADITRYLRPGKNEIVVELVTDRHDGGLLNPLYLAGEFGVQLDPLAIVKRSEAGAFEAWEANGPPLLRGGRRVPGRLRGGKRAPSGRTGLGGDRLRPPLRRGVRGVDQRRSLAAPPLVAEEARVPPGEVRPGRNEIAVKVKTEPDPASSSRDSGSTSQATATRRSGKSGRSKARRLRV